MPILNEGLSPADFKVGESRFGWTLRLSDTLAFLGPPRPVVLPPGLKIYKLTTDGAPDDPQYGITPWWSAVDPYEEDYEGACGRYEQAVLNGIDMSSMVRYMSAVRADWNALKEYVEVTLNPAWEINCFWGKFSQQPLYAKPNDARLATEYAATTSNWYSNAVLPMEIGVLEAWQFYIPGLHNKHLLFGDDRTRVNAHNMPLLGRHLGVSRTMPLPQRAP